MKDPWELLRRSLCLKSLWWGWIATLTRPISHPTKLSAKSSNESPPAHPLVSFQGLKDPGQGPPLHHICSLNVLPSSWECNQILLALWLRGEMNSALEGLPLSWDAAVGRGMSEKSQGLPPTPVTDWSEDQSLGKDSCLQGEGASIWVGRLHDVASWHGPRASFQGCQRIKRELEPAKRVKCHLIISSAQQEFVNFFLFILSKVKFGYNEMSASRQSVSSLRLCCLALALFFKSLVERRC